jgi:RNA polymerase sigma-54 factor
MKQSLDLKIGQHLTITPQLQQAIRLLQLSSLELQQEIQEALENNPLLEEIEDENSIREEPIAEPAGETSDTADEDYSESSETASQDEIAVDHDAAIDDDAFKEDLIGNENWEDGYESRTTSTRQEGDGDLPDLDARNSAPTTLREHLLWQMQMTPFSEND